MKEKINIIIVDDNPQFLEAMEFCLIDEDSSYNILAKFKSGSQLIKSHLLPLADLILLDIEMPEINGLDTAKIINYEFPEKKMIAVTMFQDRVYLTQIIEVGFKGFVNKAKVPEQLFDTINSVLNNEFNFPDDLSLVY